MEPSRFTKVAGAIISIGWALKLNSETSNEEQSHIPMSLNMRPTSSSAFPMIGGVNTKKKMLLGELDEEDMIFFMANGTLSERELNGINWGHWYIKPRSIHWWDQFFGHIMVDDPERFKELFRVSVTTFHYIIELVSVDLETNPPLGLANLPNRKLEVSRQVAMSIRRLATGDSMTTIGEMFGVSNSTVSKVVTNFIHSLIRHGRHHLTWPNYEGLKRVKAKFEAKHGIPQVCGAIDCTHIQVDLPGNERATDYFDKDGDYSFTLQAIVDSDTRFLDIFAGYPGVVHDARVFSNSGFKAMIDQGERLNGAPQIIGGVPIPELLLGDAGYTQSTWMLIPIPGYNLATINDQFNFKHSSTRMCVERSFGIYKGVWRILKRTMHTVDIKMVPRIIFCCCLLHNIMLDKADEVLEDLPLVGYHDEGVPRFRNRRVISDKALAIRHAIVEHLWSIQGQSPLHN